MFAQKPAYKCWMSLSAGSFLITQLYIVCMGFSDGTVVKNLAINAEISGLGRYPGGGNGNPLQYSCLENPLDRGAWRVTAHEVTKSQIQLSTQACTFYVYNGYHTKYILSIKNTGKKFVK